MRKYNLKNIALHPFLIGLYPVLALLGHNISEVRVSEATRSMLFMLMVVGILGAILWIIFRSWRRAALAATFVIVIFLSYGYLYDVIQQNDPELLIGRHRFLIPLYFFVVIGGLWGIKRIRDLDVATQIMNIMSFVVLIIPLYQIFSYKIVTAAEVISKRVEIVRENRSIVPDDLERPDVYYIILDAYPRADVLQEVHDFDNSAFLSQLREMGFYVAECSQSNYSKTSFSLTSSLNMNYIDVLEGGDVRDLKSPATWIRFSEVKKNLDSLGYITVSFSTGFPDTELTDVDVYIQAQDEDLDVFGPKQSAGAINNFEALLVSTSGLVITDALTLFGIDILPQVGEDDIKALVELAPIRRRYVHVLNALNELNNITAQPSPKFVFAHIISPHIPFIFAEDGTFTPRQEDQKAAYVNQLTYLNQRVITIVEKILENSEIPPIIVIQGDHGSTEVEYTPLRVMILSAYYLPNGGDQELYSTITPVNSFRLIFDTYFGYGYGLLEDVSYNSKSEADLLDLEVVPNFCDR
jgi:hypothetical protein